jgi:hypothetical protein
MECLPCLQRLVLLYKLITQFQGNFVNKDKMRLLIILLNFTTEFSAIKAL